MWTPAWDELKLRLTDLLERHRASSGASGCLLVLAPWLNDEARIDTVTQVGTTGRCSVETISALVVRSFESIPAPKVPVTSDAVLTSRLQRVGPDSVHLTRVGDHNMLVTVFDTSASFDVIRSATKDLLAELAAWAAEANSLPRGGHREEPPA